MNEWFIPGPVYYQQFIYLSVPVDPSAQNRPTSTMDNDFFVFLNEKLMKFSMSNSIRRV